MRAAVPTAMPGTPDGYTGWRRSLRMGATFHLHRLGRLACDPRREIDRNASEAPSSLASYAYWGACPRCLALSTKTLDEAVNGL